MNGEHRNEASKNSSRARISIAPRRTTSNQPDSHTHGDAVNPYVHSIYARTVLDWLNGRGIPPSNLLSSTGLAWQDLSEGRFVDLVVFRRFVDRAVECSGEPALGLLAGSMFQPYHSPVGIAAVSSVNLGQSLQVLARHAKLLYGSFDFVIENGTRWSTVRVIPTRPLHDAHKFVMQFIVGAHCRLLEAILGRPVDELAVGWPYSRPAVGSACSHYLRRVEFDCEHLTLMLPAETLLENCVSANEEEFQNASLACQRMQAESTRGAFAQRVQHALLERLTRDPESRDLAMVLGISVQTLSRRLAEAGTSYSELKDKLRKTHATWYLKYTDMSIGSIASQLGYSELASFSRAFRRWHCMSPRAMRQNLRSSSVGA